MNNKEITIQKALGTYLSLKWKEREQLWAEGNKLYTEANKLHTEANKLQVDADELYINAVMEVYGPGAVIDWNTGDVKIND